jgi:hypothetical protein
MSLRSRFPGRGRKGRSRAGWLRRLLGDVLYVMKRDKKWWLLPLIALLLIFAALLAFAMFASPLAPFIYPLL